MLGILNYIRSANDVLGLNRRNQEYVRRLNPTHARRLAKNKIHTKKLLAEHEVPTPSLYKVIRYPEQIPHIEWQKLPKSFVAKPNRGAYGAGILIFYGRRKKEMAWIQPGQTIITKEQLETHLYDILEGKYSSGSSNDIAFFEERITNHPVLKPYAHRGIPDIRIIVVNNVPVMAELRLPTQESKGKANLHAGGIGVGIDIATGITTKAIHRRGFDLIGDLYDFIDNMIDPPHLPLRGIQIPYWEKVLEISIKCQQITGAGFLGADIVIDRNRGPLVLEVNTQAGLSIQLANQAGLRQRLEKIKDLNVKTTRKGIRIAKTLFGGEIEEEIESITGRQIVGIVEKITVLPNSDFVSKKKRKKPKPEVVKAKIDTGPWLSALDFNHTIRLGYTEINKVKEIFQVTYDSSKEANQESEAYKKRLEEGEFEQISGFTTIRANNGYAIRPIIEMNVVIASQEQTIRFTISDRHNLIYPAIIARRDLKNFLIDTSKTFILH